ncbi:5-oxoprolinase subunit PxpA [Cytobacillus sp. IB215665]|uniref:5-oxoprolinase subunit PxpA n=1 Tax=Cytobacillus sp. IB215665 TaxID=3097357 RepID=UPI002A145816|nr:5-oxoprolinase subunit PxpA [Cytobacillus sp. IB215665]MDX8365223.1 5-oxoprolinase subunit PxpA [Cytobacillus sp. IB215665]
MKSIDLNCDLGESFGAYTIGQDDAILDYVSSANIACGFHAGDHNVMAKTVKLAKEKNVAIGAHPGLPDLIGFGRREMKVSPEDVYHFVIYQLGALQAFCTVHKVDMQHVKPHGALYNMAATDIQIAAAIANAVKAVDSQLVLFGLANSKLIEAGQELGLSTASEVFADRTYQQNGTLTPRSEHNALIHDDNIAVNQIIRIVQEKIVTAVTGENIHLRADTVCVHGDGPQALMFVKKLFKALSDKGFSINKVGG